jgi:hypothetical protein
MRLPPLPAMDHVWEFSKAARMTLTLPLIFREP